MKVVSKGRLHGSRARARPWTDRRENIGDGKCTLAPPLKRWGVTEYLTKLGFLRYFSAAVTMPFPRTVPGQGRTAPPTSPARCASRNPSSGVGDFNRPLTGFGLDAVRPLAFRDEHFASRATPSRGRRRRRANRAHVLSNVRGSVLAVPIINRMAFTANYRRASVAAHCKAKLSFIVTSVERCGTMLARLS